jgi:Tfp pilus assembly protein PilF
MALAAEKAGDSESAIKYLEKALQLDPFLVTPYRRLALLYNASHQLALARQTYERFLKAFPESIEAKRDALRSTGGLQTNSAGPQPTP